MASGDTAPPIALASSPPAFLGGQSPSNLSSPLSDVEDRDAYPDEMDLGGSVHNVARLGTPEHQREDEDDDAAGGNSDGESRLSDVDVNDSEAETERLYDTPQKNTPRRGLTNGATDAGGKQFIDRRLATFEPSPSKLQQQVRADVTAADDGSDDDSLSEPDDDISMASSEPDPALAKAHKSRSQSQANDSPETKAGDTKVAADPVEEEAIETRKRKRSSVAEQSELDQPLRKRTGSIGSTPRELSTNDNAAPDDEGASSNARSGEQTGEEDNTGDREATHNTKDEALETTEAASAEPTRSRQSRRNGVRKRKSPDDSTEGPNESAQEDSAAAEEGRARTAGEEQADAEADEEAAEAALRNEEERTYKLRGAHLGLRTNVWNSREKEIRLGGAICHREAIWQFPRTVRY